MEWIILCIAGVFECVWALALKASDGFTRLTLSVVTVVAMVLSFVGLTWALRGMPVGTGYAVWTGIGAAGTAIMGMLIFGESATPGRLACIGLIVAGIVGLKVNG